MSRTFHLSVNIRGMLLRKDRDLHGMITDDEGRTLSASEARLVLMDELAKGRSVLPLGEKCDGWSYETGCPGHPAPAAEQEGDPCQS